MFVKGLFVLSSFVFLAGCGSSNSVDKSWDLKLTSDKSKITLGSDVKLDTNITGYKDSNITYIWKDGNTTLTDTTASVTLSNLGLGVHHISANVTNTGTTKSALKDIEVVDKFFVTINAAKSTFGIDENVTLDANITGFAGNNPTYTWKEGAVVLGNQAQFKKDDFNKSEHHVVVIVSDGDTNRSDSFDFNVSDFTNFEKQTLSARKDEVLFQKTENLMWVSDMNKSKEACLAIHKNIEAEYNASKTFCQDLHFAGFDNGWRKPTVGEIQSFITQTIEANILPAYYAPCKFLIGVDGTQQVILTRYGQKFGFGTAGDVNGTFETVRQTQNIGLRCVRTKQ
jgi:hypothetical protein